MAGLVLAPFSPRKMASNLAPLGVMAGGGGGGVEMAPGLEDADWAGDGRRSHWRLALFTKVASQPTRDSPRSRQYSRNSSMQSSAKARGMPCFSSRA